MKKIEELRDVLCETLDNIAEQNEITQGDLDLIDKLTHSIKSIDTIIAMEEGGYSRNSYDDGSYDDGYTYRYGRRGSYARGRNARRDSRGRYSRRYSRDEGKEEMMERIEEMMEGSGDPTVKHALQKALKYMEE